ncbi:MAG: glycosyltransferase [Nitrospiraceae bacterium]|nr:glycosyltransferase [Nitrospiraceae bacterium]
MQNASICIVGPSITSGISYYTIGLANALSSHNDVSVVCFRNLLPRILFPGRAHVGRDISDLEFSPDVTIFDGMDYNNPLTWWRAYRFLMKQQPDVIILQWWTSSVAHLHLIIKIINLFIGARLIIEFHEVVDPLEENILPIRWYSKTTGRLLRRNVDGYITHSSSDRGLVAERYHINPDTIRVIPHALYDQYSRIDKIDAKKKLSIKEEFVILSFGLIRKYKGIPYLISADEIVRNSRLLIVGEIWDDRGALLRQIDGSKYNDKITLIDEYIPDDRIPLYFSAADVIALPYTRASQSGIAHIAMCFGTPIIVSKVGGLTESMAGYEGTVFVPPCDADAITRAIESQYKLPKLFNPPERRWNDTAVMYQELIDDLI